MPTAEHNLKLGCTSHRDEHSQHGASGTPNKQSSLMPPTSQQKMSTGGKSGSFFDPNCQCFICK